MTDENEIRVHLAFTSSHTSPDEVTRVLGVKPNRTWLRGETISGTKRQYSENGWRLASGLDASHGLEEHLLTLLTAIEPLAPKIAKLAERWDTEIGCVIYASQYVPEMHFSPSVLRRLSDLGVDVDIDLYCLLEAEEQA